MTFRNRNSLFALIVATGAALSLPAMAQNADAQAATAQAQQAKAQAAQAQETAADASATAARAEANSGGQSWASVDVDADGNISKSEAKVNAGLSQVFDHADSNKDGKLTPDEYKAYAALQQK